MIILTENTRGQGAKVSLTEYLDTWRAEEKAGRDREIEPMGVDGTEGNPRRAGLESYKIRFSQRRTKVTNCHGRSKLRSYRTSR
jgi:hypothetical protein